MPVTDAELLALKRKNTPYKVSIGRGAYLLVRPDGKKYWRLKYQLSGKESTYGLGVFPDVSLDAAKLSRDSARALIREGINPSVARREARSRPATTQPLFRLEISKSGSLTIETEGSVLTLTSAQTQALAAFLSITRQLEKDSLE